MEDINAQVALTRQCLLDELPEILVDLILYYVKRMFEERYYTWKELGGIPNGITYVFMLNMTIYTHNSVVLTHECEVDVVHGNNKFRFIFVIDGIRYILSGGNIFANCLTFLSGRVSEGANILGPSVVLRQHAFE